MSVRAVLPQENALPGAEQQPAGADGHRHRRIGEHAARVRRHVVGAFGVVAIGGIAVRRPAHGQGFEVAAHVGVGVLGDGQRAAGMTHEDVRQADGDPAGAHDFDDARGDVDGAAAAGLDVKDLLLGHGAISAVRVLA